MHVPLAECVVLLEDVTEGTPVASGLLTRVEQRDLPMYRLDRGLPPHWEMMSYGGAFWVDHQLGEDGMGVDKWFKYCSANQGGCLHTPPRSLSTPTLTLTLNLPPPGTRGCNLEWVMEREDPSRMRFTFKATRDITAGEATTTTVH